MRGVAAALALLALLAAAPGVAAQEGSPFGPVGPSVPPEEAPAEPVPQPQPMQPLPVRNSTDDPLPMAEAAALLGMAALLFLVTGVAIGRDARRATAPRKRTLMKRSSSPNRGRVRSVAR